MALPHCFLVLPIVIVSKFVVVVNRYHFLVDAFSKLTIPSVARLSPISVSIPKVPVIVCPLTSYTMFFPVSSMWSTFNVRYPLKKERGCPIWRKMG